MTQFSETHTDGDFTYTLNWTPERGAWVTLPEVDADAAILQQLHSLAAYTLPQDLRDLNSTMRRQQVDWAAHGLVQYDEDEAWTDAVEPYRDVTRSRDFLAWGKPGGLNLGDPFITVHDTSDEAGCNWVLCRVGFRSYFGDPLPGNTPNADLVEAALAFLSITAEEAFITLALQGDAQWTTAAELNAQIRRGYRLVREGIRPSQKVPYSAVKKRLADFDAAPAMRTRRHRHGRSTISVAAIDVPGANGTSVAAAAAITVPDNDSRLAPDLWQWMREQGIDTDLGLTRVDPILPATGITSTWAPRDKTVYVTRRPDLFADEDASRWLGAMGKKAAFADRHSPFRRA